MKPSMRAKLEHLDTRLAELNSLLTLEESTKDMDIYRKLTREHSDIATVVEQFGMIASVVAVAVATVAARALGGALALFNPRASQQPCCEGGDSGDKASRVDVEGPMYSGQCPCGALGDESDGNAKVELALAKGKREYDKRQTLREQQDKREAARAMSTKGKEW